MSNTRKIDLAKLAAVLTGQPARRAAPPARSVPPAFPRIPLARIEELLGVTDAAEVGGMLVTAAEARELEALAVSP